MDKRGIIAIISGFSGAGKGTVVNELINKYGYEVSVSATTRAPRTGDVEGKDYFFKTVEEFEKMIENHELIEYAKYVGNYYGTPKQYVLDKIEQGKDVLLEIEMQGALQVKEEFPDVSLIFITPPSFKELRRRLEKRGTESNEQIEKRLLRAAQECSYMPKYDYVVVNDGLDECVKQLHGLLCSIHCTSGNQKSLIDMITLDSKTQIHK